MKNHLNQSARALLCHVAHGYYVQVKAHATFVPSAQRLRLMPECILNYLSIHLFILPRICGQQLPVSKYLTSSVCSCDLTEKRLRQVGIPGITFSPSQDGTLLIGKRKKQITVLWDIDLAPRQ